MENKSFKPIISDNSIILILGSMPGVESLKKQQYYANKKNHFWDILFRIFNHDSIYKGSVQNTLSYNEKIKLLQDNNIALWDVLEYCDRKGSLDRDIRKMKVNDFNNLFKDNNTIKKVLFNGQTAFKYFKESYSELLNSSSIQFIVLNSTSSSNNNNVFEILNEWRIQLEK